MEDSFEGVRMRVITTEARRNRAVTRGIAKKILAYYNITSAVKFPLRIGPDRHSRWFGGAMENWGGITYNESILLFDPKRVRSKRSKMFRRDGA